MRFLPGFAVACAAAVALPLLLLAQTPQSASADIELQLGDLLMNEARFRDAAVNPYRRARRRGGRGSGAVRRRAQGGPSWRSCDGRLRPTLNAEAPPPGNRPANRRARGSRSMATRSGPSGCSMKPSTPTIPRSDRTSGKRARITAAPAALTARSRLADALVEAQEALRLSPREAEFHHSVGLIYERQHRFDEAAVVFGNYVNLLPNHERSEKAMWTRAEIRFLDSFKGRQPMDMPASLRRRCGRCRFASRKTRCSSALKVNGAGPFEFVLDTGAEQTVVSRDFGAPAGDSSDHLHAERGRRRHRIPRSAGRPHRPARDRRSQGQEHPVPDQESSARRASRARARQLLAAGARAVDADRLRPPAVDDGPLAAVAAVRDRAAALAYRLATVRGVVNGQPASFVVDTGGEAISISQTTAGQVAVPAGLPEDPLKVYGTSGWDKDAFLMPNVDLEFNSIRFSKIPVVVLNLRAPSALLGYELGGIVGHKFLSKYRVSIDLERSVVGLDEDRPH